MIAKFTAADLKFLKVMRIKPPEEPELATHLDLDKMGRAIVKVPKWPNRSER